MGREYKSLLDNEILSLVDLGSIRVFHINRDDQSHVQKFNSRLVTKGCSQQFGVNNIKTFSAVIRYENIRFLFSKAAEKGISDECHKCDPSGSWIPSELYGRKL